MVVQKMMRGGDRNSGQEAGGGSAGRCGGAGADGDEGQGRKDQGWSQGH